MEVPVAGLQGRQTYEEVRASGPPSRPLEFPEPEVHGAERGPALVIHLETGQRQRLRVIYKEPASGEGGPFIAYYPLRMLQEAIFGSVWCCIVLQRHHGPAIDEAASASPHQLSPYVWEVTNARVAIKMMLWSRIQRQRGRMLEDPVKEITAMQLLARDPELNLNENINYGRNGRNHIITCEELLQDSDFLYVVMPYCAGGDLFGVVVQHVSESQQETGMPEPVARYWFRQILSGVNYLQSRGVCHRDLSLENILVHEENCFIIDMGMCLRVPYSDPHNPESTTDVTSGTIRRLIRPQGTCGKHNYMSPEIYSNNTPFDGFSIDIWALSVILYIMLTGFPPYDHATPADPRFQVIVEGRLVQQLQEWGVFLSDEVGHLMQSMLQHNPRNRLTLDQVMRHPWVTNAEIQPPVMRLQPWHQA